MAALRKRILLSLVTLGGLLLLATTGYVVIEGQSFGDSLYMTVITITAVGYEEVWPLS